MHDEVRVGGCRGRTAPGTTSRSGIGKSPTLIDMQNTTSVATDRATEHRDAAGPRRCVRPRATTQSPAVEPSTAPVRRRRAGAPVTAPPACGGARATMKNGAPMKAVTMPTCISPGRATTRPMTSAPSSRIGAEHHRVRQDPAVVGPGDRPGDVRHGEPDERDRPGRARSRRRTSSTIATAATMRASRPTRCPSERATSSPSASALSDPADGQRQHRADDDERRDLPRRSSASRPASEPTAQKRNWSSVGDVDEQDRGGDRAERTR